MRPNRPTAPIHSAFALVVLVAIALCLPLYAEKGWPDTHERQGYIERTVEYVAALRAGHWYPRWCPDFYGGYGSPFFNYYAPLVYAIAAYSKLAGSGVVLALKGTIVALSVLGGVGVFAWVKLATRRSDAAVLASAFYLALPYRLTNLYVRGDLAEYAALCLLPVALAAYTALARSERTDRVRLFGLAAALAHAALLFSHAISALWGTELIACVLTVQGIALARQKAWPRVHVMAASFLGALALSCVYTVPALLEKKLVQIERIISGAGNNPVHRWLYWDELTAPGGITTLGTPVLVALGVLPVVCLLRRDVARRVLPWLAAASVYLLLILPHGNFLWRSGLLPFGHFIQFPWRLLGLLGIVLAFATGSAFATLVPRTFALRQVVAHVAAGLILLSGWRYAAVSGFYPADKLTITATAVRSANIAGTDVDEYLPSKTSRPRSGTGPTVVIPVTGAPRATLSFANGFRYQLDVDAAGAATLDLNVHWFPGWALQTLDGPRSARLERSPTGLLRVEVPAAGHYRLAIAFGATTVRALATAISILAALLLYPVLHWLSRRRDGHRFTPRTAPESPSS